MPSLPGNGQRDPVRLGAEPARPETLEDYADLFRTIGLPPVANGYQDDRAFSWMRVAGPNPVVLQRWQEPDSRLPLTDADLQVTAPDDSLVTAFAEGTDTAFTADPIVHQAAGATPT